MGNLSTFISRSWILVLIIECWFGLFFPESKMTLSHPPPPPLEGPECYHVYISYDNESESDTVLARYLASELFQQGLVVKLHEKTERVDLKVIECSKKVILVATESYLTNPCRQQEAKIAMLIVEELLQPQQLLVLRCGHGLSEGGTLSELSKYATLDYDMKDPRNSLTLLRQFAVSGKMNTIIFQTL